jgi:hypothetical protein
MIYDRPIWALMQDAAAELSPPYTVGEIIAYRRPPSAARRDRQLLSPSPAKGNNADGAV